MRACAWLTALGASSAALAALPADATLGPIASGTQLAAQQTEPDHATEPDATHKEAMGLAPYRCAAHDDILYRNFP